LVASGAEVAEATIRVWVRFRRDITAANRLKVTGPFAGSTQHYRAGLFLIQGTRLEILCKTGTKNDSRNHPG
jgi:head-tail adaptor